jgi:nucleoside-diphosphate-sugar epimerase
LPDTRARGGLSPRLADMMIRIQNQKETLSMRVLVIGGTRFIGPPTVRRLADAGHELTVFHRGRTEADLPKKVSHIHGDRLQLAEHHDKFRKLRPDVVLDMAAFTQQEALATVNAFRGLARRLVALSSQDVYRAYGRFRETEPGLLEHVPLTEEAPLRDQLYPDRSGSSDTANYEKILVERAVMGSDMLRGTVLRLPMVYGEGDYQHRLLMELKRIDDGRPAILIERRVAEWRWSRGYVENVAAAVVLAVNDERAAGRVYNVAEADALSYADWVRQVGVAAGWGGSVVVAPDGTLPAKLTPPKGNYAQHLVADTTRIRTELGYQEPVSRDEALRRTIAWERANRPEYAQKLVDYAAEDAALAEIRARNAAPAPTQTYQPSPPVSPEADPTPAQADPSPPQADPPTHQADPPAPLVP